MSDNQAASTSSFPAVSTFGNMSDHQLRQTINQLSTAAGNTGYASPTPQSAHSKSIHLLLLFGLERSILFFKHISRIYTHGRPRQLLRPKMLHLELEAIARGVHVQVPLLLHPQHTPRLSTKPLRSRSHPSFLPLPPTRHARHFQPRRKPCNPPMPRVSEPALRSSCSLPFPLPHPQPLGQPRDAVG